MVLFTKIVIPLNCFGDFTHHVKSFVKPSVFNSAMQGQILSVVHLNIKFCKQYACYRISNFYSPPIINGKVLFLAST